MALPPEHQQRRVLVVDPDCLLAAGLVELLSKEAGAEIRTIASAAPRALAAAVRAYQPQSVVLPLHSGRRFPHDFLATLSDAFVTHLVCINPDGGAIRVFELTELPVTSMEDVLALLHPSAPAPPGKESELARQGDSRA